MTQATATAVVHDLIGVGFGPSNIALAIALQERAQAQGALEVLFLDKQGDYRWHGNTLVSQSELQISFLKDLVSLRNPTSPYSFVNYLHKHDRLVDFINLGTFYPCRMEFNDYLRWVASHFQEQSRYGEEVLRIEPMLSAGQVEALRVISRNADGEELVRTTRALVVSPGGTPRIPQVFRALKGDGRVFHHSQYLEHMAKQPCSSGKPMKIAIIIFSFPAHQLNRTLATANPAVFQSALTMAGESFNALLEVEMGGLRQRIELFLDSIPDQYPSLVTTAKYLRMNERTVRRRLADEGCTYRQIVDKARKERAIALLLNSSIPVDRISDILGYSETASFRHAFRRWTGQSTTEFRNSFH